MEHQEFNFTFYNTVFFGQYYKSEKVNGVIILVHGMGEHSSRYGDYLIPKFLEHGISVITYDQFGHGKTGGKKGHNPNFEALLETVTIIKNKANDIFGDVPFFLYGHSMGGNVVLNYALRKEHNFKGIIATSPFLRISFEPPAWKLSIGKIIQKIAPSITMPNELDPTHLSRDSHEVKKYIDDPLVHNKISPNYSLTFFETGEWAIRKAQELQTPTLVVHGTDDKITDHKASKEFVENTNDIANLSLFKNGYHELHNDLDKERFAETIISWISNTL